MSGHYNSSLARKVVILGKTRHKIDSKDVPSQLRVQGQDEHVGFLVHLLVVRYRLKAWTIRAL